MFKIVKEDNDEGSLVVTLASALMASMSPWTEFGVDAAYASKLITDKAKQLYVSWADPNTLHGE
jgi:hypothetical protein